MGQCSFTAATTIATTKEQSSDYTLRSAYLSKRFFLWNSLVKSVNITLMASFDIIRVIPAMDPETCRPKDSLENRFLSDFFF